MWVYIWLRLVFVVGVVITCLAWRWHGAYVQPWFALPLVACAGGLWWCFAVSHRAGMSGTGESEEKRNSSDRRRNATSFWDVVRGTGRRMRNRRAGEHDLPYFVERFSLVELVLVILFLVFTLADGILTVRLLDSNCEEVNPLMDFLLRQGLESFFIGKYVLTAAGLPFLLIFKHWYLFNTRLRVGHVLPIFVLMYVALLAYQSYLFSQLPPMG